MTPGFGYFDNQWQMPAYGAGFDWNNAWNTYGTTTPYYGSYDYGFGYSSDPNSVIAEGSTSSKKEETTGDFLEKQKAKEKEIAQARIQGYAQKNMLENGLSKYTVVTTIGEGEQAQQAEVYADANGNPLKFKVENGQVVFDEKGVPVQDPNGQVVPVMDKKNIEQQKQKIEAGKKADGSSVQSMSAEEYEKKVPWYKRALRAVGNMATGVWNMGKSLVGFDENGKWQPLKALKNAAIVAAGVALTVVCPAAGPVLLYAGLAMGAYQTGKGVYKACTAKTVEEIDAAWQDTGAGVATAAASAAGLRGMGRAAGANAFTPKGAATIVRGQASKNALTFKGGIKWDNAQFKSNLSEMNPFAKKQKAFESTKQQTSEFTQGRIQEIDTRLAATDITAEERAFLTAEKSALEASRNLANTARTKVDFAELNTQSGATRNVSALKDARVALRKGESFEFNGVTINPTEANLAQVDAALQRAEALTTQYNRLLTAKNAMMNSAKYRVLDRSARSEYMAGAPKTNWYSRKSLWNGTKKTVGFGMKAMMWEYELYKSLPAGGQTVAFGERFIAKQHREYGSMYDMAGGVVDGFFGTNSGAMYAPQVIDAATVSENLAACDKEIEAVKKQMNDIDAQIRELSIS